MTEDKKPICPHCGDAMRKWRVPIGSTWPNEFFYVCFNDKCPYFVKGWEYMWERQQTKASYRCRMDPETGTCAPLPVWSREALKDQVVD